MLSWNQFLENKNPFKTTQDYEREADNESEEDRIAQIAMIDKLRKNPKKHTWLPGRYNTTNNNSIGPGEELGLGLGSGGRVIRKANSHS